MVAKKKATTGKGQVKKLILKKETLKDLDAKGQAKDVKGGANGGHGRCTGDQSGCN